MNITMKMIARYKDIITRCDEIDMVISDTWNAKEVATAFVMIMIDDTSDIVKDLYELITNKEYSENVSVTEVQDSFETFFTDLPKSYLGWTVTYLTEKHLQYKMGINQMINVMANSMVEKMQTRIGESTEH
jgi:hypothetical protein